MTYFLDFIVYVWLFPVVLLVVVPLAVSTGSMFVSLTTHVVAALKKSEAVEVRAAQRLDAALDKRLHPRFTIVGTEAVVSDGVSSGRGMVSNISKFGMSLVNLPERLYHEADKLSVVIRDREREYAMKLMPRWAQVIGTVKSIGGEIESAPAGWAEFISQGEPEQQGRFM